MIEGLRFLDGKLQTKQKIERCELVGGKIVPVYMDCEWTDVPEFNSDDFN